MNAKMKTATNATTERLHGAAPYYWLKKPAITSSIFGRCVCGGLRIYGVCQSCGTETICMYCKKTKINHDTWAPRFVAWACRLDKNIDIRHRHAISVSHGQCTPCTTKEHPVESMRFLRREHGDRYAAFLLACPECDSPLDAKNHCIAQCSKERFTDEAV
jgi:cytochrome c5